MALHNASKNVYISDSNVAGRGLFAAQDLPAGAVALEIRRPLVAALDNKRLPETCAKCFAWAAGSDVVGRGDTSGSVTLKTCLGCGIMRYCSKKCQSEAWQKTHKAECKILKSLSAKGSLPNAARAVLQMLQSPLDWTQSSFKDMTSHLNDIIQRKGERAETLHVLSTGIHHYSGTKHSIETVQNCFALVLTNSLTLWTPTFDPLGICLDPVAASANHSCEPNAITVFDGAVLQFRTLKPVTKNEEVFISYIDSTDPLAKRQSELEERFYFKSVCAKCRQGRSTSADRFLREPTEDDKTRHLLEFSTIQHSEEYLHSMIADAQRSLASQNKGAEVGGGGVNLYHTLAVIERTGFACLKSAQKSAEHEPLDTLESGLSLCEMTTIWPPHRQPLPSLRQELFVRLLTDAEYAQALVPGFKLYFEAHPVLYPQTFHPVRVVHKWTLAMLALYLASLQGRKQQAQVIEELDLRVVVWGLLVEVENNVRLSHGESSSFARGVEKKVGEVRTEMTRVDAGALSSMKPRIEEQWTKLRALAERDDTDSLV